MGYLGAKELEWVREHGATISVGALIASVIEDCAREAERGHDPTSDCRAPERIRALAKHGKEGAK